VVRIAKKIIGLILLIFLIAFFVGMFMETLDKITTIFGAEPLCDSIVENTVGNTLVCGFAVLLALAIGFSIIGGILWIIHLLLKEPD